MAWLRHVLRLDFERTEAMAPEAQRKAEALAAQQRRARRNVERAAAVVEAYGLVGHKRERRR